MIKIESIEIGHGFLTVWSPSYPEIREYCRELYKKLPERLQELNPKDLWYHNPPMFHPYGQGPAVGRTQFKHFHIIYPNTPTDNDVRELATLIGKPQVEIELLEDYMDDEVTVDIQTVHKAYHKSVELYQELLEDLKRGKNVYSKELS